MTAHATVEQLTAYLPDSMTVPADADRLLERASEVIDDCLVTAFYSTDILGVALDAEVLTALQKATCAQVEFWLAGDEEDDILGPVQGVSLGGMQLQYGAGENRTTPTYLAPRAARALRSCPAVRW